MECFRKLWEALVLELEYVWYLNTMHRLPRRMQEENYEGKWVQAIEPRFNYPCAFFRFFLLLSFGFGSCILGRPNQDVAKLNCWSGSVYHRAQQAKMIHSSSIKQDRKTQDRMIENMLDAGFFGGLMGFLVERQSQLTTDNYVTGRNSKMSVLWDLQRNHGWVATYLRLVALGRYLLLIKKPNLPFLFAQTEMGYPVCFQWEATSFYTPPVCSHFLDKTLHKQMSTHA